MNTRYAQGIIDKLESVSRVLGGGRIHDLRVIRSALIVYVELSDDNPADEYLQEQLNAAVKEAEAFLVSIVIRR